MPRTLRVGANNELYVDDGAGGGPEKSLRYSLRRADLTADELALVKSTPDDPVSAAILRDTGTIYSTPSGFYLSDGTSLQSVVGTVNGNISGDSASAVVKAVQDAGISGGGGGGVGTSVSGDELETTLSNGLRIVTIQGSPFALLPTSGGNVVANLTLRRGTSASLAALAGGNGEISVADDAPVIYKMNGAAGGAVPIAPFAVAQAVTRTVAGNAAVQPAFTAKSSIVEILGGAVTGTAPVFPMNVGYMERQRVLVFGIRCTIRVATSSGSADYLIPAQNAALFEMVAGYWVLRRREYMPSAPALDASAIDGGVASATGSTAVGALAAAQYHGSTAIGNASAPFPSSVALSCGANPFKTQKSIVSLGGKTTTASQVKVLTADGLPPNAAVDQTSNIPYRSDQCVMFCTARIIGRVTGDASSFIIMERNFVYTTETDSDIHTVHAVTGGAVTDLAVGSGMAGYGVQILSELNGVYGMTIAVTAPSTAKTIEWGCVVEIVEQTWVKV